MILEILQLRGLRSATALLDAAPYRRGASLKTLIFAPFGSVLVFYTCFARKPPSLTGKVLVACPGKRRERVLRGR